MSVHDIDNPSPGRPNELTPQRKAANLRFYDALQKEPHSSPGLGPIPTEDRVGLVLIKEFDRTVGTRQNLDQSFREELERDSRWFTVWIRFTSQDGTYWDFEADKSTLHLTKVKDRKSVQLGVVLGRPAFGGISYSEGIAFVEERNGEVSRKIDQTRRVVEPVDIGGRGVFLLDEFQEAMKEPPIPTSPLVPDIVIQQEKPFRIDYERVKPARRIYSKGELDDRFYSKLRPGDLIPPDLVDRENPSTRLSRISDEKDAWAVWQRETPFVDDVGNRQTWRPEGVYYYSSEDELQNPVRLRVQFIRNNEPYQDDALHIRELSDTEGINLEDKGQASIRSVFRSRYAEWRDPGVGLESSPTSSFSTGKEMAGDTSKNPLRKCERALVLLGNSQLIGYESIDGGFIPAHRTFAQQ